jgi:hypothetical protein
MRANRNSKYVAPEPDQTKNKEGGGWTNAYVYAREDRVKVTTPSTFGTVRKSIDDV